jgi:hypothetical protein
MLGRGAPMAAFSFGALFATTALAHIDLVTPEARYSADSLKNAPCGPDPATNPVSSGVVTTFAPGETITVTVDEFVGHNGTIVVAIDPTGTDDFHFPSAYDDIAYPNVLAAEPDPPGGQQWAIDVTLPDAPCDPCTLQVIQIMEDGNYSNDDFYFQCADIVIDVDAPGGSGGSAGTTGPSSTSGPSSDSSGGGNADDSTGSPPAGDAGASASADGPGDGSAATSGSGGTEATGGAADGGGEGGGGGCRVGGRSGRGAMWAGVGLLLVAGSRRRRR